MTRYSFSEVVAELENDNHLAFTLYGGLYLSNDTGDRKEFKVGSSTLETV